MNILDYFTGFFLQKGRPGHIKEILLRETQAVRVSQSHKALYLVAVTGPVYIWALWNDAPRVNLVLWIGVIAATSCLRTLLSGRIEHGLSEASVDVLYRNEFWLFVSSVLNTIVVGSGFWLVCLPGTDRAVLAVTLLSCIYAIGTTINSSIQFSTFPVYLLANLGQGIAFFLLSSQSAEPEISMALLSIMILLIQFGKRNAQVFSESITSREEIRQQNEKLAQDKVIIEQALSAATEANEDKSRFLAAASHDLRQPLHAITLFLASLRSSVSTDKSYMILDRIEDAVHTLSSQFNSLLDLSKFDAGVVEANYSDFDLANLLQSIYENVLPDAKQKGLELRLETSHINIHSDILLLDRLLRNIVLNAIRYTNEGRVVVSTRKLPGMVTVSVLDTGPGIPKIVHRKIFDDFYQHNNPARSKDQGSGLGLAIVKRISVLLKLEVSLESTEDSGTVFSVNIPLAEEASEIIEPVHRHGMSDASMKSLDGVRILAVDDNPDILEALGQLLSDWGCAVSKAQSPEAALQIMNEGDIDFALIDDMLGEHETGLDLAINLANNIPKSRILVITGNVLPNRLSTIREHGFSVFLKPLDPQILFEELSSGRR